MESFSGSYWRSYLLIRSSKIKKENNMGCLISNMESHKFSQNKELTFQPKTYTSKSVMGLLDLPYAFSPRSSCLLQPLSGLLNSQPRCGLRCNLVRDAKCSLNQRPFVTACCVLVIKIHRSGSQRVWMGLASLTISPSHSLAEFVLPSPQTLLDQECRSEKPSCSYDHHLVTKR